MSIGQLHSNKGWTDVELGSGAKPCRGWTRDCPKGTADIIESVLR